MIETLGIKLETVIEHLEETENESSGINIQKPKFLSDLKQQPEGDYYQKINTDIDFIKDKVQISINYASLDINTYSLV